jgi:hypothetical protein
LFCKSIEKSFHSFRNLVNEFKAASSISETEIHLRKKGWSGVPESTQTLIAFSDAFSQVIESEPISSFIGKVRVIIGYVNMLKYYEYMYISIEKETLRRYILQDVFIYIQTIDDL